MHKSIKTVIASVLVTAMLTGAQSTLAHHSSAMFDHELVLELSGTIKEFQFTNPHSWVQVNVESPEGEVVEWSFEWGSPNQLGRRGIRPSSFPIGDEVLLRTNPMLDGTAAGAFIGAKFSDGTTIGRWEN